MSAGKVPSGHQYSSVMSLGSPYNLATARNGCTGVLESDLLTLISITNFGGCSVMVWGAFSFNDRTPLYVIDGNVNGNRYVQEVIQPFVIPALQRIRAAAMFQDDNTRPHPARVVTDFLGQHNVNRMDWPPYSPDLNSIEHAWDELGRRLRHNHAPPANHAHLALMLVTEWHAFFQRLVNSIRRRCTECINARGGYTHY